MQLHVSSRKLPQMPPLESPPSVAHSSALQRQGRQRTKDSMMLLHLAHAVSLNQNSASRDVGQPCALRLFGAATDVLSRCCGGQAYQLNAGHLAFRDMARSVESVWSKAQRQTRIWRCLGSCTRPLPCHGHDPLRLTQRCRPARLLAPGQLHALRPDIRIEEFRDLQTLEVSVGLQEPRQAK